jgi:sulfatase maturation enzyme AslB (radical SAM superfamily)
MGNLDGRTKFELEEVRHLVTAQCNLHCEHCYNRAGSNPDLKSRKYTQEEIDRFYHYFKPSVVSATGGEPLLELNTVLQIAKSINSYGGELELVTNAYLLTEYVLNQLLEVNPNLSCQISLDGLAEYHNRVRGNDQAFNRAIMGIQLCLQRHIPVKPRLTLTANNFDETFKVIDLLNEISNANDNIKLIVRPVVNYGRARDNNIKSVSQSETELKSMFNDYSKHVKVGVTERCGFCTNSLAIDYKGDMYECCYLISNPNFLIGNITDDFSEMTRNEEFLNHKGKCYIKDNRNL